MGKVKLRSADKDFVNYWSKVHNTHVRVLISQGIDSWEKFQEFVKQDDFTLLKVKGLGVGVLYQLRLAAHEKGWGDDPGERWQFAQKLADGPILSGFGPVKKLGLTAKLRDKLTMLQLQNWDDLAAESNLDLWRAGLWDTDIWELRAAQSRAGRGDWPGPSPQTAEDKVRLITGGHTTRPLPPLSAADEEKLAELHQQADAILRQAGELQDKFLDVQSQMLKTVRGHCENISQANDVLFRYPLIAVTPLSLTRRERTARCILGIE